MVISNHKLAPVFWSNEEITCMPVMHETWDNYCVIPLYLAIFSTII